MRLLISTILLFISLFFGFAYGGSSIADGVINDVTPDVIIDAGDIIEKNTGGAQGQGGEGVKVLIVNFGEQIMMPIIVVIGILLGLVALYKVIFSEDEEEKKKALGFFTWGVFGIMILYSAIFIGESLVGEAGNSGIYAETAISNLEGGQIAAKIYDEIVSPFVSIFMYLMIGIMVMSILLTAIKTLSSPDKDETVNSARTIIVWNLFGILAMVSATEIVNLVYGGEAREGATSLSAVSEAALSSKDLSWLAAILNYFAGFMAIIITVFIVYQAYILLTKPDDEETLNALKRNFVYVLLGLLILGGVYLIVHFIII